MTTHKTKISGFGNWAERIKSHIQEKSLVLSLKLVMVLFVSFLPSQALANWSLNRLPTPS